MRLIGTAGHIDHGKSTLVQALTGIHPSRLPEEQEREMTIDLGYAHLDHPDGYRLGVVDVPGHERLVKNMVAGATGFELALWVVDAREGVMPQSLEHLQILDLLGVRVLVPVLTKVDVASEEQVAAARGGMEALLRHVEIAVEPVRRVDSLSGRGIPELKEAIFTLCRERERTDGKELAYLPVDRVFSLRGIGTVVTGTLMRGRLTEGDQVALSSGSETWRVRSLTNHHARVREIGAGHRVGINLAGLDADAARRGDTLLAPGYPYRGRFLNVRLRLVEGVPFEWKHGLRMLFYAGAAEMECRLWGVVREGGSSWAQVELPRELPFFPGQRCILRSTNPLRTVAGGEVMDLAPDRPRQVTPAERSAYEAGGPDGPSVASYLSGSRQSVLKLADLARRWMVAESALSRQVEGSPELCTGAGSPGEGASPLVWRSEAGTELLGRLRDYVERQPPGERSVPYTKLGREMKQRTPYLRALLRGLLELEEPSAAFLRDHTRLERTALVLYPGRVTLTPDEQRIADVIVERLQAGGLQPPRLRHLRWELGWDRDHYDRILAKLEAAGQIVRASPDLALHPGAVEELRRGVRRLGLDGVRAGDFGKALGLSRKYSIPILEYLNKEGVLRRDGDLHYLA